MAIRNKWKQFRPAYLAQRYLRAHCRDLPLTGRNVKYKVENSIEFSVKGAVYIDLMFERKTYRAGQMVTRWY